MTTENEHDQSATPTLDDLRAKVITPTPYAFDDDDAMALHDGQHYAITSPESYEAGWETLRALTALEKAVIAHHDGWKAPLNAFRNEALKLAASDLAEVELGKKRLGKALPEWKRLADQRDAEEQRRQQEEEMAAARAMQAASVASLQAVAEVETNPVLKASIEAQAAAVESMPPPVKPTRRETTAKTPRGGSIPKRWKPQITDVRLLLKAWLDGKAHLDIEQALIDAITPKLAGSATSLGQNIGKVFPGVTAILDETAQARR